MSTISVPLTAEIENFINHQVAIGRADSKAGLIRQAILRMEEEYYINEILEAEREMKEGKIMSIKDGKMSRLRGKITMGNGSKVNSRGLFWKKNGRKKNLKNGDHIDLYGKLVALSIPG